MIRIILFVFFGIGITVAAQDRAKEILPSYVQIKMATRPLPEDQRDGAMVYGYDSKGQMVVLRDGTNHMVCLADDPNKEGIQVACYSKKLEPFMKRGRELTQEGKDVTEIRETRGQEIAEGSLVMPREPSMTYVYFGSEAALDGKTGEMTDGKYRYVIYIPYATAESTGLPLKPMAQGMPWLMDPGTPRAHIMIGPCD